MSKFKTIQQQSSERLIEALFSGLDEDISLKTAMEVMFGLRPESDLDELRKVNEENLKSIEEKMQITLDASGNQISIDSNNEDANGNSTIWRASQGQPDSTFDDSVRCVHTLERDDEEQGIL
jgi:hypothetical protein